MPKASERRRGTIVAVTLIAAAMLPALTACKVVPIAADRAARERQAGAFDATRYVEAIWDVQAAPFWDKTAKPLDQLLVAIDSDLNAAGAADGRKAGDGSPWTFVAKGEGRVVAVDHLARAGSITLATSTAGGEKQVTVLTGPVVSGAALRDSLPFVTFNDFTNQIAFAEVGGALTRRALRQARPAAETLKVGDRIRFEGVFQLAQADERLVLTPVRLEPAGL